MDKNKSARTAIIVFLALNLTVTILLVIAPQVSAAAGCFPDTNGHWAENFICWMQSNGIVGGYPDGNFKPGKTVTRAEVSVMIKNAYDLAQANDDDTLAGLGCSTDQIAKWNGSAWECRADLSGAGGDYYTKGEADAMMAALESRVEALETKLASVTTENGGQDVVFTGVNVHVRDGSGDTDGTVNGLGNLIVGYNEDTGAGGTETRTGSHNLVLGAESEYTSYGGFVGGYRNTISGPYSSVSGGYRNTASGDSSSVSGGSQNTASGDSSSVSGGWLNTASGYSSSVSGGQLNTAIGTNSSVSGGRYNTASGEYSSVLGGGGSSSSDGNEAWANLSVVGGGSKNTAGNVSSGDRDEGLGSAVLAGAENQVTNDLASISGGKENLASGFSSSISGGEGNTASGGTSSISGGSDNTAGSNYSSVSGGNYNTASGGYSSVSGGWYNTASGGYSSVSGGNTNTASGSRSSVSGGLTNTASGTLSSVSGGFSNTASGGSSSVSGGQLNTASGNRSAVSGGYQRSVSGTDDWRAGDLFETN